MVKNDIDRSKWQFEIINRLLTRSRINKLIVSRQSMFIRSILLLLNSLLLLRCEKLVWFLFCSAIFILIICIIEALEVFLFIFTKTINLPNIVDIVTLEILVNVIVINYVINPICKAGVRLFYIRIILIVLIFIVSVFWNVRVR